MPPRKVFEVLAVKQFIVYTHKSISKANIFRFELRFYSCNRVHTVTPFYIKPIAIIALQYAYEVF